jgi:sugar phosphate isomerase/epimerase
MEDRSMSIVVRFSPANLTTEKYDDAIRRHGEAGIELPPDGMEYHVCFGSEGNLRVSEIWDSREQLEAYGERLMPILADAGIEFSAEPEILEVHNIIKR